MMTTYGEQVDHTPHYCDVHTWLGSYNERTLILQVGTAGKTPLTRTLKMTSGTSCGDVYEEELIASGPGWIATVNDNFDIKRSGAENLPDADDMYDCVAIGILGMVEVYPFKRAPRPGEIGMNRRDQGPSEEELKVIHALAIQYIDFLATHQD